jgi:3-hydroxyisobutyrate dehydrogenase
MAIEIGKIGFIGLGLMGLPMVNNLIKNTPDTTTFFVYDVVEDTVKKFCDEHSTRAKAMKSSRDVAEEAVCEDFLYLSRYEEHVLIG